MKSGFVDIIGFAVSWAGAAQTFLTEHEAKIDAKPQYKRALAPLFSSTLNSTYVGSILTSVAALMNCSLVGSRGPQTQSAAIALPSTTFINFAMGLGSLTVYLDTKDPASFLITANMVSPLFKAMEHAVLSCHVPDRASIVRCCKVLRNTARVLPNAIGAHPGRRHWGLYAELSKAIARPDTQRHGIETMRTVLRWLATVTSPETAPAKTIGILAPLYGFTLVTEAAMYELRSSNVMKPYWADLAASFSGIADSWLMLSTMDEYQIEDVLQPCAAFVSRTLNYSSGTIAMFKKENAKPLPTEAMVPVLNAIERLSSMVATAATFQNFELGEKIQLPIAPALIVALSLSVHCGNTSISPEALQLSPEWSSGVVTAAFEALQAVSKSAIVLAGMDPLRRGRVLEKEISCQGMHPQPDGFWIEALLHTASMLFLVVDRPRLEMKTCPGEEQDDALLRQNACAVLTLAATYDALWKLISATVPALSPSHIALQSRMCEEVLCKCLLPGDSIGLQGLPLLRDDEIPECFDLDALIDHAKYSDAKDCGRMKLRALVLGNRLCGNLKCKTVRVSSEKKFGKLCAGCRKVKYCCAECQKSDWKVHKLGCRALQEERS